MSGQVPEAAVEAVRQAVEREMRSRTYDRHAYDEEVFAEGVSDIATAAVTAAAPHLRRAVLEELLAKYEPKAREGSIYINGVRQRSMFDKTVAVLRAELEGGDRG